MTTNLLGATLRVAALAVILGAVPAAAQNDQGQNNNSQGQNNNSHRGARSAPEFDPAVAGVIAAVVAGGGVILARRRRR